MVGKNSFSEWGPGVFTVISALRLEQWKMQKSLLLSKKWERVLGGKKKKENEEEMDTNIEIPGVYL